MLNERKSTKIQYIIQCYFVQVRYVTGCASPRVHTLKKKADKSVFMQAILEAKNAAEDFDRDAALEALASVTDYTYGDETDGLLKEIMNCLETFDCGKALVNLKKLEEQENGD